MADLVKLPEQRSQAQKFILRNFSRHISQSIFLYLYCMTAMLSLYIFLDIEIERSNRIEKVVVAGITKMTN